ncbi:FMN-dependent NADH-azoreductase [Taibaiella koreensis]|uniref:FMN-dependent NADH-azoreductase n=1 Tax=Taibaiella koreensis TaxID=1268548 RepID=UPI000E5A0A4F|nr:NAD(P)H-dependent oxidoreductase [Taibaiella koreensis]
MKVLHIDCSVRNEASLSRQLSGFFVTELRNKEPGLALDYLDLGAAAPDHVSALFIEGNYTSPERRTPEMIAELAASDKLIGRLHDADVYVIGMPMYNFTVPSNFKVFIDNVVRTGMTFRIQGMVSEGLLVNKKVYVINTRGVDFSHEAIKPMDQLVPYLKTIFAFIGLDDAQFIDVFPVKFSSEEVREKAIAAARQTISACVRELCALVGA